MLSLLNQNIPLTNAEPCPVPDFSLPPVTTIPKWKEWLEGTSRPPGRSLEERARWHDRRCDINRRLAVHQERGGQARSADAFLEEGQPMVLRHEGARGRRCQQRACAHRGRDERQRARCEGGSGSCCRPPCAYRSSITTFWPSMKPRSCRPCRNASMRGGAGREAPGHRMPIRGMLPSC